MARGVSRAVWLEVFSIVRKAACFWDQPHLLTGAMCVAIVASNLLTDCWRLGQSAC